MPPTFHLSIVTPEGEFFQGDVIGVQAPGSQGSFEVLSGHASYLTTLQPGLVIIRQENDSARHFHLEGGILEMLDNQAVILAEKVTEKTAEKV